MVKNLDIPPTGVPLSGYPPMSLRSISEIPPTFVRMKIFQYLCSAKLENSTRMKNRTSCLFIFIAFVILLVCLLTESCASTRTEVFHGDKDSVIYHRSGSIEFYKR